MQDLNDKVTGNTLTATEWNQVPSEIQNVIEGLGITLSSGDLNQLGKAISGYVANGEFYTDSGAADAHVLAVVGSKQRAPAYTDGFRVRFIAAATNTGGAINVNVGSLGVKSIKTPTGNNPPASAISVGQLVSCYYDNANGWFVHEGSASLYGTAEIVYALTGTTPALDPDLGTRQTWALTAPSTPTDGLTEGQFMYLKITDASGHGITWPSVSWTVSTDGDTPAAPTISTTKKTIVQLWKEDSTLYGALVGYVA